MQNILIKSLLYSIILILSVLPSSMIKLGISSEILPAPELLFLYFLVIHYDLYIIQIFLYGIFIDELQGLRIGLTPTLLILCYYIIVRLKPHIISKGKMLEIGAFAPLCIIYSLMKYFIIKLCLGIECDAIKISTQTSVTILFYPSIYFLLNKILEIKDNNVR